MWRIRCSCCMEVIPFEKARRLVGLSTQTARVTLIQAFPATRHSINLIKPRIFQQFTTESVV